MTLAIDQLPPAARLAGARGATATAAATAKATAADVACSHCGLPVPAGLIEVGAAEQFCCAGCRMVFQTLHACGLESYYRLREAAGEEAAARPAKPAGGEFQEFDSPTFQALYVQARPDGSASVDLALEGVTCAACVWLIERLPRVLPGVIEARLSLREATVRVTWGPTQLPLSRVAKALDRLGYTPHPARGEAGKEIHRRESRRRLVHIGVAGAIAGNTMLLGFALYSGDAGHIEGQYRTFFRWLSAALGLLALAWPGATFFRAALAALRARVVNLDVPIALALAVGGVAGLLNVRLGRGDIYFDSLSVLIFLLLVGRFIQYRQQRRADDAVGLLFSLTPSTCHVLHQGAEAEDVAIDAPVEALKAGDRVEVRPGELFPADGVVESGSSSVNAALLTGESLPTTAGPGSVVHAGARNVASALRVRVEKVGRDTRVGRLMNLIEQGVRDKPAVVQFADRVGAWFVVAVSLAAAGVLGFWWKRSGLSPAIDHAVALLIVTCPCVLGLATPLTIAIAIGRLARRDILVKSGAALERLSRGGRLLLDKTGTLTEGKLELVRWEGEESIVGSGLLDVISLRSIVAELERTSNHPIGRALASALAEEWQSGPEGPGVSDVVERGDGGVSGRFASRTVRVGSPRFMGATSVITFPRLRATVRELEQSGSTAVVVAVDGVAVAVAGLGDRVRPDAAASLARLRRLGWDPAVLSGDAQDVVSKVAAAVGIPGAAALGGQSPEQKLSAVHQNTHDRDAARTTVMVGDGVNDAAALAAADVGIAVHGGAEASLSAADVYVARPGLAALVDLAETSRRAMRVVYRNLAVSLAYNLLAGALAATGHMSPLIAAILMPLSSATVLSLAVVSITRGNGPAALAAAEGGASWK